LSARNVGAWIGICLLGAIVMYFSYTWNERDGYLQRENVAANQLELYVTSLESELGKYEFLPNIIQLDVDVLALLGNPDSTASRNKVNTKLANYNVRAGSIEMFVLDTEGIVRASSNWYQPQSSVGKSFALFSYFSEALAGRDARFFSINQIRNSPEYYFAHPIRKEGKILGVAAVKISLEPIESTWTASSSRTRNEKLFLIDENGIVIISSFPDWKFKPTGLSSQRIMPINPLRKPGKSGEPFVIALEQILEQGARLVRLPASTTDAEATLYVAQERPIFLFGWRMIILSDASDVQIIARQTALGAGAIFGFLGLLGMYLLQRRRVIASEQRSRIILQRSHDELELGIRERTTELQQTNAELVHEVIERKRIETELREAQAELVQATKLALLGQMSAGITHEINQPLTALRALSHNTQQLVKRGRVDEITKNLKSISDLTERMVRITAQLKSFARKTPITNGPVVLMKAVENALVLMENRIASERIELQIDIPAVLAVFCDSNRLEQVLLNLFSNAFDAMKDALPKILSIRTATAEGRVLVRVIDSGQGIPEATMQHLFEPFFSTKPVGEGLGLGLVISASIVREFGGQLRALNTPGGASFEFDLPIAEEHAHV
jgi:two-component system C4-dicarboxylate transport sensor histidine kinase DctB